MSHLSRDERLLALDGALEAARQTHLATCHACAADVQALAQVLARVRAVDVPEPSPLFWDHLAARVGDAIAREPAPRRAEAWWAPRLAWAAAALTIVGGGAAYLARSSPPPAAVVSAHATVPPSGSSGPLPAADTADALLNDDGWALIAAVAEGADDETLTPQVGQAELSISALSPEERAVLARELAAELTPSRVREG